MKRSAMKTRRRDTGTTPAVRDLCFHRDRMACVLCGETYDLQLHHRTPRGLGGSSRPEINSPANLVVLHRDCHAFVESERSLARERGYLVPHGHDPAETPIMWHGQVVLLRDDGTVEQAA